MKLVPSLLLSLQIGPTGWIRAVSRTDPHGTTGVYFQQSGARWSVGVDVALPVGARSPTIQRELVELEAARLHNERTWLDESIAEQVRAGIPSNRSHVTPWLVLDQIVGALDYERSNLSLAA
jgi:hypothetical protein